MKTLIFVSICAFALSGLPNLSLAGDVWLDQVILFDQPAGSSNQGGPPENALGPNDDKYVSIDTPETAIFAFSDNTAENGPGNDLRIYEYSNGDSSVDVYVSKDNIDYVLLGRINGNAEFDLESYGIDYVVFIKFVGLDNGGSAAGFDLDAVEALNSKYDFCECDLNQDGKCDMLDWLLFGQDWGRTDCEVEILGTWIGNEVDGSAGNWAAVFTGYSLNSIGAEEFYRGTYVINKNTDPHLIDFIIVESHDPGYDGKASLGIYEIVGDALTIVFNPPGNTSRPSTFTPDGVSRVWVLTK
jgi:uncharacterized protein (TIGR03067 family)